MSDNQSTLAHGRPDWRSDIEGMRAVGALLVAIFHIWIGGVSGGVDAFFVVAGFFMTQSAMREAAATGRIDVLGVWSRLAIRLLPGFIICLLGVTALTFLFLTKLIWADAMKHVAASAVYALNWYLIVLGKDAIPHNEFEHMTQHFWAVSIIGQAYLLMPVLLAAALRLSRKGISRGRVLLIVLAGMTVASFVYNLSETARDADAAYYNLLARLWEFGVGGMIAAVPGLTSRPPRRLAVAGSWLGLGLLVTCGIAIGTWASFPGIASLWPVAAASLILLAGRQDDKANAGWLLSRRPLRRLGSLAYGIYMWHWPLTILALEATYWESLTVTAGCAIIAAAIGLAWASERLSQLILGTRWLATSRVRTSVMLASSLVLIAGGAILAARMIGH